jgi:hypothetical protein
MYLLKDIQEASQYNSAYGSYITPGTVLRCDGTDRGNPGKPDASATFISYPYFDVGKGGPADVPKDRSFHFARGLFQHFYPNEVALDRDGDQLFRKFRQAKHDQYLRVPQLWVLILNSKTIITCGASPLEDLFKGAFEFAAEDLTAGPSMVQVTDFFGRVNYLPIDQCRTFLELKQSIQKHCISKTDGVKHINDCLLHLGDSEDELEAEDWPRLLRKRNASFIYIRVSRKVTTSSGLKTTGNASRIAEPEPTKMIDYADLNSEEEPDKGNGMALILRPPR